MRLLINASTTVVGGGAQVAISFINEIRKNRIDIFCVIACQTVYNQIDTAQFGDNFSFHLVSSPARLKDRRKIQGQMNKIADEFCPDVVFTVFGPPYWKVRAPHLCGFAIPAIVYNDSPALKRQSLMSNIVDILRNKYKIFYFKQGIDRYWVETEDVKNRLAPILGIDKEQIIVLSNNAGDWFYGKSITRERRADEKFRLLYVTSYYKHKNIEVIKKLIPLLKKHIKFTFVLTLPFEIFDNIFSSDEKHFIENIGSVSTFDCPSLYNNCDAIFLPSLLECFSANIPEAFMMARPLLASDLSFNRDVAGRAALYFDPLDPQDIAEKILMLFKDEQIGRDLVKLGASQLQNFLTARERAEMILQVCRELGDGE